MIGEPQHHDKIMDVIAALQALPATQDIDWSDLPQFPVEWAAMQSAHTWPGPL